MANIGAKSIAVVVDRALVDLVSRIVDVEFCRLSFATRIIDDP